MIEIADTYLMKFRESKNVGTEFGADELNFWEIQAARMQSVWEIKN